MITKILESVTTAIVTFLQSIGSGTVDFFESIFTVTTESGTDISNLGIFILALLGISIALAVVRAVWSLIGGYKSAR